MEIFAAEGCLTLYKEGMPVGRCEYAPEPQGTAILRLEIAPAWRRRGYGTYLLRELLHRTGGYDARRATRCTAPAPADAGTAAFWEKFDFAPAGGGLWERRRRPDLSAVQFAQDEIARLCPAPRFCIDATCGNGGDTEFLCRLCAHSGGQVLAMDLQPEACARTRARLTAAGFAPECWRVVCDSHANLAAYAPAGSADAVLFNFGWLPGAEHAVYSTAESSLPALAAALTALRRGGVLSAVLYSGRLIGSAEKQAVLHWLRALPLTQYTVLVCEFANWADTAPLPCLVLKK
jgi:GNAT superfamily N-acetyltransferase